jgi:hypothetical protein
MQLIALKSKFLNAIDCIEIEIAELQTSLCVIAVATATRVLGFFKT